MESTSVGDSMKELKLAITPAQVEEAKEKQAEFDAQKTYNKFVCKTNYIGLLGEMVFNDYLTSTGAKFEWVQFTKQGWNDPDFIIGGKSIDLKTTFSPVMWMQKEKWDIYLYAHLSKDEKTLTIKGWLPKEEITKAKASGKGCKIVNRGSRQDWIFMPTDMYNIEWLSFILEESVSAPEEVIIFQKIIQKKKGEEDDSEE